MTAESTLQTYNRVAQDFFRQRSRKLFERPWLDRMLGAMPAHHGARRLLDLGCGTGQPIAAYMADRRVAVNGVDGAPEMLRLFRANLPHATAIEADMRDLALGTPFDGILAWNSFFHLTGAEQRAMFPVFRRHAAPGAALMFTSGPSAGEVWGEAARGAPIFHASLAPEDYEALLTQNGFRVLAYRAEDPDCNGHTVWLARFTGA